MTCECGRPGCAGTPQHAAIADAIRDHGQFLVAVLGDEDQAPFVYTIGRTEQGRPELLIELDDNTEIQAAGNLLNYLVTRDVQPGQTVGAADLGRRFQVVSPPEDDDSLHEAFIVQADHYYGRPVTVLCLVAEPQSQATDERLH